MNLWKPECLLQFLVFANTVGIATDNIKALEWAMFQRNFLYRHRSKILVIFSYEYSSFDFFQPCKNVKRILNSQTKQEQAAGQL